ncbi:putative 4-hydroxyphenylpyruvate dioxygenase [Opisthorchis viverrini]|uniref:Putative 4-hydroxyphenylpyruvate dioxygenase n=1 Tax=Opisthorchis viverrini TaxID=6198 RepID=A0A1S8WYY7_OPIVI|nr:putative 4-hydroxyphenylpyruvate dioxygenase [Opisthorchis viverrini]
MSLIRRVHHLQFACQNLWNMCRAFTNGLGFNIHSFMRHENRYSVALGNGSCMLLLNQTTGPPIHWRIQPSELSQKLTDSYAHRQMPFDIALEVQDVSDVCTRVRHMKGTDWVLVEPLVCSDNHGRITMAVIKSCIKNLFHTLLDTSQYDGPLLPGFTLPEVDVAPEIAQEVQQYTVHPDCPSPVFGHLDHIALACNTGESDPIIQWYKEVFGMKRVAANILDDPNDGFLVEYGHTGMKLKAASYTETLTDACTFVLVEPLEGSAPNQVTRFLDANGGPGIQHIGFAVDDIFTAVDSCKARGTSFVTPPQSYYDAISQIPAFARCPVNIKQLRQSGVLLDPDISPDQSGSEDPVMLLQIFTMPLFERDAFFVELIQRCGGASGFGAGNILALWKALEDSIASGDQQQQNPE